MDFSQALAATLSPIQSVREAATSALEGVSQQDFATYVRTLVVTLGDEQQGGEVRQAAGVAIKNALVSKDATRRNILRQRWLGLAEDERRPLREQLLKTIQRGSGAGGSGTAVAQAVAAIAGIELPAGEWMDLMGRLVEMATNSTIGTVEGRRKMAIETIGFICEELEPRLLERRSNEILTAIIAGLRVEEPSMAVKATAVRALLHSVDFIRFNMARSEERDLIMTVVCNATQVTDDAVRVSAFECLTRLIGTYYHLARSYVIEGGVGEMVITTMSTSGASEEVLMQAIEFWSSICEIEIDLHSVPLDANTNSEECHELIRHFLSRLLPTLLQILPQRDEDVGDANGKVEEDEWNASMASATCLSLVAECVGNEIFRDGILVGFVEQNILAPQWTHREAALMALGSIIDGPEETAMQHILPPVLPVVLGALHGDSSVAVRDAAAWVVGRAADFFSSIIPSSLVPEMVRVLIRAALTDAVRVSHNCCWSLMTMAVHYGNEEVKEDSNFAGGINASLPASLYDELLSALSTVAHSAKADEYGNLRVASFQALANAVLFAPQGSLGAVRRLQGELLEELRYCATHPGSAQVSERCGNVCVVLANCLRKAGPQTIQKNLDAIMQLALTILTASGMMKEEPKMTMTEAEDVLMLVGTLISEAGVACKPYVDSLVPILFAAITTHQQSSRGGEDAFGEDLRMSMSLTLTLAMVALGVVGDMARALGSDLIPYGDALISHLLGALQSTVNSTDEPTSGKSLLIDSAANIWLKSRRLQPHLLNAVADVALALEGYWQKYLAPVMYLLGQVTTSIGEFASHHQNPGGEPEEDDLDELDWIDEVRLALLNIHTSIVQVLKTDATALAHLAPYVPQILVAIRESISNAGATSQSATPLSDDMVRAALGLIGDLVDSYRPQMGPLLRDSQYTWLLQFLASTSSDSTDGGLEGMSAYSENTLNVLRWTQSVSSVMFCY